MHKEIVKRQGNTVLIVIGLIILVFICMSILNEIIVVSKYSSVVDLVGVGILTAFAYFVMRYMVVDYKYTLIDTDLIFQRIIGNRETVVLDVNIEDIVVLAPASNKALLKKQGRIDKTYRLCVTLVGKNKYFGIFEKEGKNYKVIFEPSEKLIKLVKKSIPDKVID
ncbi:hypothetical protein [Petroclostridium sp. X23]|uniref:hypothetical protein n=1 Tax=Petroclostridium sp. X23 TaxID=3045146 RepID=UPI0024ACBE3C|nr:hypothetical protein [Petroclostridium sp. X23]WHH57083.1 hypothetical protein QKW49_14675 [Petroclostridium sp. X23]